MTANLIAKTNADLAKYQEEAGDLGKELESTRNDISARDTKRGLNKAKNAATIQEAQEGQQVIAAARTVLAEQGFDKELRFNAVFGLLETIGSDFKRTEQESEKLEAQLVADYTSFSQDAQVNLAMFTKDVEFRNEQISNLETALPNHQGDLETHTEALKNANEQSEALKPPCLTHETLEERAAKRQASIDALNEALQMVEAEAGGIPSTLSLVSFVNSRKVPAKRGFMIDANTVNAAVRSVKKVKNASPKAPT
jgi:chromosome segregation ATPase